MKSINCKTLAFTLLLSLLFLILFSSNIKAQQTIGQIWHCSTMENLSPNSIKNLSLLNLATADTSIKTINIFIH